METRRWFNPHQPQTLQIAVILLYFSAVMSVFLPPTIYSFYGSEANLIAGVGLAAAAFGIANERRWGYLCGLAVTALGLVPILLVLVREGPAVLLSVGFLLASLFPVARFALLVHPMSREHQRIWFH